MYIKSVLLTPEMLKHDLETLCRSKDINPQFQDQLHILLNLCSLVSEGYNVHIGGGLLYIHGRLRDFSHIYQ